MDLWNGSLLPVTGTTLTVSLNAKQARLFRLLNPSVLQSPQITSNRALSFKVSGNAGYSYIIQSTTNLVTWNPVATVSNITGSVQIVVTNAPLPAGGHFYRAGMLP
jgi:hypothetical protein